MSDVVVNGEPYSDIMQQFMDRFLKMLKVDDLVRFFSFGNNVSR